MNCYLDRELDMAMVRTRHRPLPAGQVTPRSALVFSIFISLLSLPLFLVVGVLVAALGAVAWAYYVLVYSVLLKRRTSQNIVMGGAAGAFPPLIGWAAVEGGIDLSAIFLFLIVFFWTPPHAYALMLMLKEEYRKVNVPMLPVVRGERETSRQIVLYSMVLLAVTVSPAALGLFGFIYLATAILMGGLLVALALRLYRSQERIWALRLFRYSNLYLAVLFLGLVLDRTFVV
jgi:protoheme IX farnesyltransferase